MTLPQHKGKIKNVRTFSGGSCYDRVTPGVTLPNEHLKGEALKAMSGEVKVYKLHEVDEKKQVIQDDLTQVNNIVLIHLSDSNSDERKFKKVIDEKYKKGVPS